MMQVLVLLFISGLIAWLGDTLGTRIGKKRLSIFGLRPKVTAFLLTISTGVAITLLTLAFSAMLSENVKIALFSVQELQTERQRLASDVVSLRQERARMASEVAFLAERVRVKGSELVVFRREEIIMLRIVPASAPTEIIKNELQEFVRRLADLAQSKGLRVESSSLLQPENREQLDRLVSHLAGAPEEMVIAAVAKENISVGESLGQVGFLVRPNKQIFTAGQVIANTLIDGGADRSVIARELLGFMDEINHEVVRAGMIENPFTKRFGDLTSDSAMSLFDMVNSISRLQRRIQVEAVVGSDTTVVGPLNVKFRLNEETEEPGASGSAGLDLPNPPPGR